MFSFKSFIVLILALRSLIQQGRSIHATGHHLGKVYENPVTVDIYISSKCIKLFVGMMNTKFRIVIFLFFRDMEGNYISQKQWVSIVFITFC